MRDDPSPAKTPAAESDEEKRAALVKENLLVRDWADADQGIDDDEDENAQEGDEKYKRRSFNTMWRH